MGKRKKSSRRQLEALGNPPCIFCGERATTFDHYPPSCFFKDDISPDGFKFPACADCNGNSSQQDLLVAVLGRLGPPESDATEFARWSELFTRMHHTMPELAAQMFASTEAVEGRERIRKRYGDALSAVHIPEAGQRAIRVFSAKLTKALHYMHSDQILPSDAAIRFRWFSNVRTDTARKRMPERSVRLQLCYVRRQEDCHYYCFFRKSFAFLSFVSFDPAVIEGAVERLKKTLPSDEQEEALERIYWPTTNGPI